MELLWNFIKAAVDGLLNAVWQAVQKMIDLLDPLLLVHGILLPLILTNKVLAIFDEFLVDLGKVVPVAALETALTRFPAPKWTRSRSLSAESAHGLVVMSIVVPSIGIVNGQLPLAQRMYLMISSRAKVVNFVFNPTFEKLLGIIFKPFRLSVLRVIGLAWHFIAIIMNFAAATVGLLILSAFLTNGEEDLKELCFPQSAPRKRRHLVGGELILRREPGGVRP